MTKTDCTKYGFDECEYTLEPVLSINNEQVSDKAAVNSEEFYRYTRTQLVRIGPETISVRFIFDKEPTVNDIKNALAEKFDINSEDFYLFYGKYRIDGIKELKNSLYDLRIPNGAVICLHRQCVLHMWP
ncbi:hypothetical protein GJ496_002895 [Pomphorhynchus laevis]|nr:hypothetical protein GJ496_002895 [Pomphorhynchus laevis]